MAVTATPIGKIREVARRSGFLERHFYFGMSLLIAAVVVYGFSRTVNQNLFHPAVPRPLVLYLHGAIFSGWVVFFILQSALVQTHNVQIHRRIGWFGAALGTSISIVGVTTAIVMPHFRILQLHQNAEAVMAFLIVPLFDMLSFSMALALAIYWRRKPEFHRRLMLVATCALSAAAFGRFPFSDAVLRWFFYVGVDLLILLGVMRDLIVIRRVHQVYVYALPLLVIGQASAIFISIHKTPFWMKIAHAILG